MKKICKLCGKEFETKSGRKSICDDDHYTTCVICGKSIKIKYASEIPKTCSSKCRMELMRRTCEEKYGSRDPGNLPQFREKAKRTCIDRYGVDNPSKSEDIVNKIKKTWIDTYGVENVSQLESHKKKVSQSWSRKSFNEIRTISENRRQTCKERYGVDNPMQSKEIQAKVQQTDVDKYGVRHHISAPSVRAKSNDTMIRRYGTIYPTQLEAIQEKRRQTCKVRYGVDHPWKSKEFIENLRLEYQQSLGHWPGQDPETIEKRKQTNIDRYGVPAAFLLPENQEKAKDAMLKTGHHRVSKINKKFQELLESLGIQSTLEYRIENKFYDICVPDRHIVIEIDPTWTHCSEGNMYEDIDKNYHKEKSEIAKRNGFHCIHVFDWDNWDKIISIVYTEHKIYARNCEIVYLDSSECDSFPLVQTVFQPCVKGISELIAAGRSRMQTIAWHENLRRISGIDRIFRHGKVVFAVKVVIHRDDLHISALSVSVFAHDHIAEHETVSVILVSGLSAAVDPADPVLGGAGGWQADADHSIRRGLDEGSDKLIHIAGNPLNRMVDAEVIRSEHVVHSQLNGNEVRRTASADPLEI